MCEPCEVSYKTSHWKVGPLVPSSSTPTTKALTGHGHYKVTDKILY